MSFRRRRNRYRLLIVLAIAIPLLLFIGLYVRGWFLLREFERSSPMDAARLLADNGEILATLGQGPSRYIPLDEIPLHMQNAIVAIEDRWFYKHPGFNPIAILRALWFDIRTQRKALGASTITQQLAKNLFLTSKKTFGRKTEELVLALILEQRYSKAQILELYLNRIYFGKGSYGIEAAARTYLGKRTSELNLADSALLAAIPRSPANYDPYVNPQLARARRDQVLERMEALQMISDTARAEAVTADLNLDRLEQGLAPYFVDYVRKQLEDKYGTALVHKGGLRVHTTLNLDYQAAAQAAFADQEFQGALVAIDPGTGGIKALVGGRDYSASQFDRATRAFRQPGSAFKPFVYAAALEAGWQENTLVEDTPREYAGYTPTNWQSEYWGPVVMKHALAVSLNNAAVWTLHSIGVDKVMELARAMGITSLVPEDRNLSLALGGITKGVSPLELATAFIPFANGGVRYEATAMEKVLDGEGRILETHQPRGVPVLSEETAYLITDMLAAVLEYGTGKNLTVNRPAVGKTGTTDEKKSVWFAGYTPNLVAVVYIGDDEGQPLPGFGSALAAPIWARFINTALIDEPAWDFPVPRGMITDIPIHIFTGLLAGPGCDSVVNSAFIAGTEPTTYAPCSLPQSAEETILEPRAPSEQRPLPPTVPPPSDEVEIPQPTTPEDTPPDSLPGILPDVSLPRPLWLPPDPTTIGLPSNGFIHSQAQTTASLIAPASVANSADPR